MIVSLVFLGLIVGLIFLSYYINYHKFGELLSLYPKNSMIFLLRDHQNEVNQIKILVFLTFINKGLKKIEITDISLNLIADKVQIPFTLTIKSEFLSAEEISRNLPVSLKQGEKYDNFPVFITVGTLKDKLKPLIITMDDIETFINDKYVIKIAVKYGTRKKRTFCVKLNLEEKTIAKLPEIVDNRVILPIQVFRILWESYNRKKTAPRKLYLW
jgi:hypothetical protein